MPQETFSAWDYTRLLKEPMPESRSPQAPAFRQGSSHAPDLPRHSPLRFPSVRPQRMISQNQPKSEESMKNTALFALFVLAMSAQGAIAQQTGDNLTDQQKMGRQVFAQSCGVCHLPPSLGAKTYGP